MFVSVFSLVTTLLEYRVISDVFFRVFVSILRGQTKNAIDFVGEPQPNRVILEKTERFGAKSDGNRAILEVI